MKNSRSTNAAAAGTSNQIAIDEMKEALRFIKERYKQLVSAQVEQQNKLVSQKRRNKATSPRHIWKRRKQRGSSHEERLDKRHQPSTAISGSNRRKPGHVWRAFSLPLRKQPNFQTWWKEYIFVGCMPSQQPSGNVVHKNGGNRRFSPERTGTEEAHV